MSESIEKMKEVLKKADVHADTIKKLHHGFIENEALELADKARDSIKRFSQSVWNLSHAEKPEEWALHLSHVSNYWRSLFSTILSSTLHGVFENLQINDGDEATLIKMKKELLEWSMDGIIKCVLAVHGEGELPESVTVYKAKRH